MSWSSYFSLFLLPVIAIYSFIKSDYSKKVLLIFGLISIFSFIPYYHLHLYYCNHSEFMHNYWDVRFIDSFSNFFNAYFAIWKQLTCPLLDTENLSIRFFYLLLLTLWLSYSGTKFVKKFKVDSILFLMPLIELVVMSFGGFYPFEIRLALPIVPILLVFLFSIFNNAYSAQMKKFAIICFCLFLPYWGIFKSITFNRQTYLKEEIKPMLKVLSANISPKDKIIVLKHSRNAFNYYKNNMSNEFVFLSDFPQVINPPYNDVKHLSDAQEVSIFCEKGDSCWVILSHIVNLKEVENLKSWIDKNSYESYVYQFKNSYLIYLKR